MVYYFLAIGLVPFLSMRAITPIFATAFIARFLPGYEPLAEQAGIQLIADLPSFFTSNASLFILGCASCAEGISKQSRTIQTIPLPQITQPAIRGFSAFFLTFFLVEGNLSDLLDLIAQQGFTTAFVQGQPFAYTFSFVIGWATFWGATLHTELKETLMDLDPEDDFKIQAILNFMETGLSFTGCIFVALSPFLAMITAVLTMVSFVLFRKFLKSREEKKKVPCDGCGSPRHLCSSWCDSCQAYQNNVHEVGFMGLVKTSLVKDFEKHRFNMTSKRRCFYCGNRFQEKNVIQHCSGCGRMPFNTVHELNSYKNRIHVQFLRTLGWCTLYGMIPILGLIPGIIYYRTSLMSTLRCYIPRTSGCMGRWMIRMCIFLLIGLQGIPILGALALPIMCALNYCIYFGIFKLETSSLYDNLPYGYDLSTTT